MDYAVAKLNSLIQEQYNLLDARKEPTIYPDELADRVYFEIDPEEISPKLVKSACLLELRQLSRAICRVRVCPDDPEDDAQGWLFKLQSRYPAERGGKPGYVLREELTYEERRENSRRLRNEAVAKKKHAEALDTETDALVRAGKLKPLIGGDEDTPPTFTLN